MAAIHAPPPPDRVRHPSWRRLLLFAGIAFIGIASLPLLDEALLSTPRERALERRIGTPILPGWLDSGRERDRKVLLFERIYDGARRNWDLFPGHFARVDAVFINDEDADFVAASSRILGLDLVFINSRREEAAEVDEFIHEMAHVWLASLPDADGFRQRWSRIAGTGYHGCGTYESCDRKESCLEFQIATASASCYGADSFDEDVAEAVRLVYNLGLFWGSELVPEHLPAVRFHEDVIPRLMQKIELLAEYRFCSEREAWQARRMLEEYLMAVTSRARGESPEATRAAEGPASGPRRFR